MSGLTDERLAALRLVRTDGVGPITYFGLLARYGSAQNVVADWHNLQQRAGRLAADLAPIEQIEQEWHGTAQMGGQIVFHNEADFPKALKMLTAPPPVVSLLGDTRLVQRDCVGLVGARNASAAGLKMARLLAEGLGQAGYVVASGLARGIDGAAHTASLAHGTIAVLAGGIDHIYPHEHTELYGKIREMGLIVSENRLGAAVQARDFPRRNRIISGLSRAIVVVEAEAKSGSLITAKYAAEQGRDVCAVPGSPLDPRAAGANGLIQDGAYLATNADDVIDILRAQSTQHMSEPDRPKMSDDGMAIAPDQHVLDAIAALLSPTPASMDDLIIGTGLPWRTIAAALIELELNGQLRVRPGGFVVRAD